MVPDEVEIIPMGYHEWAVSINKKIVKKDFKLRRLAEKWVSDYFELRQAFGKIGDSGHELES